jgi:hypothetical protein
MIINEKSFICESMLNFNFSLFFLEKIKNVMKICNIRSDTPVLHTKLENELCIFPDTVDVESVQFKKSEISQNTTQANTIFFAVDKLKPFNFIKSIVCNNCLLIFLLFALSLYSILICKK